MSAENTTGDITDPREFLTDLRANDDRMMTHAAVTVWKDGGHKIWSQMDAKYAQGDPDWLTTINLPVSLDLCPRTLG